MPTPNLLSISNDAKTVKGEDHGYLTGILYLAPADISGRNVCSCSTEGCRFACLNTAGRGAMSAVQQARIRRTNMYYDERERFLAHLVSDIHLLRTRAQGRDLTPCVRLNGTSDLPWERVAPELFTSFHDVQFYDYTKRPGRTPNLPPNYSLTFSRSETNEQDCLAELEAGVNVACVFHKLPNQATYTLAGQTYPLVSGDLHDLRFLDPTPAIVALSAKGRARRDTSGFVIHTHGGKQA